MRRGRQQEVTGIVVNDKLSIDRKTLRNFRAALHQVERDGIAGKRWGNSPDLIAALDGYANFVLMVDKERGAEFKRQVSRIIEKYRYQKPIFTPKQKQKRLQPKNRQNQNNPNQLKNGGSSGNLTIKFFTSIFAQRRKVRRENSI